MKTQYECLIDECDRKKFKDRRARKFHLVDFHKFSKFFTFDRPKYPLNVSFAHDRWLCVADTKSKRHHHKPKERVPQNNSMDVDSTDENERGEQQRVLGSAHADGKAQLDLHKPHSPSVLDSVEV